jgi:hypothetical protein
MSAASIGDSAVITWLLAEGARVDMRCALGATALDYAREAGFSENNQAMTLLLDAYRCTDAEMHPAPPHVMEEIGNRRRAREAQTRQHHRSTSSRTSLSFPPPTLAAAAAGSSTAASPATSNKDGSIPTHSFSSRALVNGAPTIDNDTNPSTTPSYLGARVTVDGLKTLSMLTASPDDSGPNHGSFGLFTPPTNSIRPGVRSDGEQEQSTSAGWEVATAFLSDKHNASPSAAATTSPSFVVRDYFAHSTPTTPNRHKGGSTSDATETDAGTNPHSSPSSRRPRVTHSSSHQVHEPIFLSSIPLDPKSTAGTAMMDNKSIQPPQPQVTMPRSGSDMTQLKGVVSSGGMTPPNNGLPRGGSFGSQQANRASGTSTPPQLRRPGFGVANPWKMFGPMKSISTVPAKAPTPNTVSTTNSVTTSTINSAGNSLTTSPNSSPLRPHTGSSRSQAVQQPQPIQHTAPSTNPLMERTRSLTEMNSSPSQRQPHGALNPTVVAAEALLRESIAKSEPVPSITSDVSLAPIPSSPTGVPDSKSTHIGIRVTSLETTHVTAVHQNFLKSVPAFTDALQQTPSRMRSGSHGSVQEHKQQQIMSEHSLMDRSSSRAVLLAANPRGGSGPSLTPHEMHELSSHGQPLSSSTGSLSRTGSASNAGSVPRSGLARSGSSGVGSSSKYVGGSPFSVSASPKLEYENPMSPLTPLSLEAMLQRNHSIIHADSPNSAGAAGSHSGNSSGTSTPTATGAVPSSAWRMHGAGLGSSQILGSGLGFALRSVKQLSQQQQRMQQQQQATAAQAQAHRHSITSGMNSANMSPQMQHQPQLVRQQQQPVRRDPTPPISRRSPALESSQSFSGAPISTSASFSHSASFSAGRSSGIHTVSTGEVDCMQNVRSLIESMCAAGEGTGADVSLRNALLLTLPYWTSPPNGTDSEGSQTTIAPGDGVCVIIDLLLDNLFLSAASGISDACAIPSTSYATNNMNNQVATGRHRGYTNIVDSISNSHAVTPVSTHSSFVPMPAGNQNAPSTSSFSSPVSNDGNNDSYATSPSSAASLTSWRASKLRIFSILKYWMKAYPHDFLLWLSASTLIEPTTTGKKGMTLAEHARTRLALFPPASWPAAHVAGLSKLALLAASQLDEINSAEFARKLAQPILPSGITLLSHTARATAFEEMTQCNPAFPRIASPMVMSDRPWLLSDRSPLLPTMDALVQNLHVWTLQRMKDIKSERELLKQQRTAPGIDIEGIPLAQSPHGVDAIGIEEHGGPVGRNQMKISNIVSLWVATTLLTAGLTPAQAYCTNVYAAQEVGDDSLLSSPVLIAERAFVFRRVVSLACRLLMPPYYNFNLFFELLTGLQVQAVHRLFKRGVEAGLTAGEQAILPGILALTSSRDNYRSYRALFAGGTIAQHSTGAVSNVTGEDITASTEATLAPVLAWLDPSVLPAAVSTVSPSSRTNAASNSIKVNSAAVKVPYLGVLFKDLVSLEDGQPPLVLSATTIDSQLADTHFSSISPSAPPPTELLSRHLNIMKARSLANMVFDSLACQQVPCWADPDEPDGAAPFPLAHPDVQNALLHSLACTMSEGELNSLSERIQPRKNRAVIPNATESASSIHKRASVTPASVGSHNSSRSSVSISSRIGVSSSIGSSSSSLLTSESASFSSSSVSIVEGDNGSASASTSTLRAKRIALTVALHPIPSHQTNMNRDDDVAGAESIQRAEPMAVPSMRMPLELPSKGGTMILSTSASSSTGSSPAPTLRGHLPDFGEMQLQQFSSDQ